MTSNQDFFGSGFMHIGRTHRKKIEFFFSNICSFVVKVAFGYNIHPTKIPCTLKTDGGEMHGMKASEKIE